MSVNAVTPYRRDYSVSADVPKVVVPQKAAPAPDESTPGPTSAPTTGATPAPPPTNAPTAPPSPSPGPAPVPPDPAMSSPEEQKLDEEVRATLKDKPDELEAYEELLTTSTFAYPPGKTERIAMLEQIKNYPETKVIEGFGRLGDRAWFAQQSAEDQQRSAKMVAFNLSDTTPNANKVRENTMDRVLGSDDVKIDWRGIESETGTTYGEAGESGMWWWKEKYINLNSDLVPAGPGKIDAGDQDAVHVVANTLAHEINHTITPGGNEQSYSYFMDEYRAWYVGYKAENGEPPVAGR
ncbi:hypothetical protein [Paracoccus sulfuroxidans]|uniref:Uncharacterized protein n=1 Tax=Paracoccus sulfuroxidans TaxID=384678 RepID=A0A562NBE0_9RHOB|nr:hypothetical protein [Paracoccus sulfuroxidans]TWI29420.1 hypothetical protein IQ24_03630 [Paracoccus sulfuroxidans]